MLKRYRQSLMIIEIIILLIFMAGSYLHYQRGYYLTGPNSLHAQGTDDAYISYRYGWNLAHYGMLSWNETGYRRTEGFTNPLWVYLSASWATLGNKELVYPLMVITSVIISSIALVSLITAVYKDHNQSTASITGLFIIAVTPAIWLYVTSGLESGVFGFGLALLAYLVIFRYKPEHQMISVFLLAILLGLIRSDAFVYLAIILFAGLIAKSRSWKAVAGGLLVSGAILLLWRQITFGEWLPNTAIAKINFNLQERLRTGAILLQLAMLYSGLSVLFLVGIAGLLTESKRVRFAGLFLILAWLTYYLFIGGDFYFERHLIGLFILMAAFSAPLWTRTNSPVRILLLIVVASGIILSVKLDRDRFAYFHPKVNDALVTLGKALQEDRAYYGVLIAGAAGKIPFYAGGDCIDPWGLNDPYLATLLRARFIPGHSSGNDQAAIELAKSHPTGVYSTFSFLDTDIIPEPGFISLWVDNRNQPGIVHKNVTQKQWQSALDTDDPLIWSIISKPISISK